MDSTQKHFKVFYGWYVVGACFLITLYTNGFVLLGFTAIFDPIAEEFGWSYAHISLASSIRGLEAGLLAPLVGILVDRWGSRKMLFIGSLILCMSYLIFSRVSSLPMFYGSFALIAIGVSNFTPTVPMTAVANWFRRKAGLATGIVASGVGLGGFMVPVLTKLIDVFQWRMAMIAVGLGTLVIVLPLSLVVRHKPERYGYQPDGDISKSLEASEDERSYVRAEIKISARQLTRQLIRNRTFWLITVLSTFIAFVLGMVMTHLMPYLGSLGITRYTSSLVALSLPVLSICGRLCGGWLADRFGCRPIWAACFFLITVGLFCFVYVTTDRMWLLVPSIITFSLGWGGAVTTRIATIKDYFGTASFGTILGFVSGIMMVGHITGAPLAGWVFDTRGTYRYAWLGTGFLTLVGAFLVFALPSFSSSIKQTNRPETK